MEITLSEAKKYIDELDFRMIMKKMCLEQQWDEDSVKACAQLYKNFLFLKKEYGDIYQIPPNEEIDLFWHNHILDTKNYIIDCQAIFGTYLHHYPYAGLDDITSYAQLKSYFENVQTLHKKEFGYFIYKIRLGVFDTLMQSLKILLRLFKQSIRRKH